MAHTYAQQSIWSGRRLVALLGAIAVNLGMIIAISSGLQFDFVKEVPPVLQVIEVPEDDAPNEVIDVPMPELVDPVPTEIEVPPVEIPIELEPPPVQMTTTTEPVTQQPRTITPPATQLQSQGELAAPTYPPISIRNEEQGTVTLLIYVLPDGRVGDVKVAKSSGFPRLDQAAMKAALGGWRFKAATEGGGAVAAWGRYAVTFNLRDARGGA